MSSCFCLIWITFSHVLFFLNKHIFTIWLLIVFLLYFTIVDPHYKVKMCFDVFIKIERLEIKSILLVLSPFVSLYDTIYRCTWNSQFWHTEYSLYKNIFFIIQLCLFNNVCTSNEMYWAVQNLLVINTLFLFIFCVRYEVKNVLVLYI